MKLHGLQKMTLLDFPGRVACTVFLGGCDFRCPFCHNYDLADGTMQPLMDDAAFFSFLKKRQGLLDGVAVTGGEPCLHRDLPDFLRRIRRLGFMTKLDTNGYHPALLKQILDEGLADYVAMDIKNSPVKYPETIGLSAMPAGYGFDFDRITESISVIMNGPADYEFRTTVVDEFHEDADFHEIGRLIRGAKRYFLQCFTDRDTVPFGNLHAPSADALIRYRGIMLDYVPGAELRGVNNI